MPSYLPHISISTPYTLQLWSIFPITDHYRHILIYCISAPYQNMRASEMFSRNYCVWTPRPESRVIIFEASRLNCLTQVTPLARSFFIYCPPLSLHFSIADTPLRHPTNTPYQYSLRHLALHALIHPLTHLSPTVTYVLMTYQPTRPQPLLILMQTTGLAQLPFHALIHPLTPHRPIVLISTRPQPLLMPKQTPNLPTKNMRGVIKTRGVNTREGKKRGVKKTARQI